MADYDLAIIGGGLNGVSIARDAAGRGLRVILLEQGDLGSAASSATSRLIHGDLSALERRAFPRVRTQLTERDIWLDIAPHVVRPMRFAIPAHADERPPWLLRLGLLLYDRLAARPALPASATLEITHHPVGVALKRPFAYGGVLGMTGQAMTILPGRSACLRCLFEEPPEENELASCRDAGIIGPIAGAIGEAQAAEASRYLGGSMPALAGKMLTYDARGLGQTRLTPISARTGCACGAPSQRVSVN